ncbi:ArsR family transcriptional regulator [Aureimonas sp. SA4125]|uniref:ArsR/SmtB family transcription factor n=1 Tax=Aureimonas sp. SA4125 TaxID=2826993 RepID=UPI001CC55E9D|nr:metalloregulator ArsR/SmtB family transcription factor [Aureimonas sp. SA4125]BDA85614.1 ArsR family transcriptional regulator [Aureimonas sp. SA4125]
MSSNVSVRPPAATLSFDTTIVALKALGEPTRLRLVRLLSRNDLTVTDMTTILGQSQPRISRHLKLLVESQILTRYQEGAWAYFRLTESTTIARFVRSVLATIATGEPSLMRDDERLEAVRVARAERAAGYFAENAGHWDKIRLLHVPDADVEKALLAAVGTAPLGSFLDIGTGTGRMIELFASRAKRAVGVDASREMLQVARAKLDAAGLSNAQVRQGDCYRLPVPRDSFDLVMLHQVLHFLDDPAAAIREAAATLQPGGRLVVVDFAPHRLEFLREEQAHLRLGFERETVAGYLVDAGLDVVDIEVLGPAGKGIDQLTVSIWLAQDRRPVRRVRASARAPAMTALED